MYQRLLTPPPGDHDRSAQEAFLKDYPESACWIVYGGEEKNYFESITAVPFLEFLLELPQILSSG